jgi:hypothetical protein
MWTGLGVEGLQMDSTRTPRTTGGLYEDSMRKAGGVINTPATVQLHGFDAEGNAFGKLLRYEVIEGNRFVLRWRIACSNVSSWGSSSMLDFEAISKI